MAHVLRVKGQVLLLACKALRDLSAPSGISSVTLPLLLPLQPWGLLTVPLTSGSHFASGPLLVELPLPRFSSADPHGPTPASQPLLGYHLANEACGLLNSKFQFVLLPGTQAGLLIPLSCSLSSTSYINYYVCDLLSPHKMQGPHEQGFLICSDVF